MTARSEAALRLWEREQARKARERGHDPGDVRKRVDRARRSREGRRSA